MLNALRIEFMPTGPTQVAEFGTVKDSIEFKVLLEMDAYQHTQQGVKYPAQLITTAFKDFRAQSYMPAKFAAKMQAANASSSPVLLFVNFEGGHFGASTQEENFVQVARKWGFLLWHTGHPDFQSKKYAAIQPPTQRA